MILWPKGLPGTNRTPSPYMDELKHKSNEIKLQAAELNQARSKLNAYQLLEEEVKPGPLTKQLGKTRKPGGEYMKIYFIMSINSLGLGSIPTPARDTDESTTLILEKLTAMGERLTTVEQSNTELRESNTELRESNTELRERLTTVEQSNTELRERNERLEATMQTTMEAVIGVRDISCIYIITYFARRIALQSTRSETEFFSTWLGISWLSSVVIRIGVIGRAMPTRTQYLI
jgi:hypothetical protein